MNVVAVESVESPPSGSGLSDRDWRKILRDIRDGKVIPVIGPEFVMIADLHTGNAVFTVN